MSSSLWLLDFAVGQVDSVLVGQVKVFGEDFSQHSNYRSTVRSYARKEIFGG